MHSFACISDFSLRFSAVNAVLHLHARDMRLRVLKIMVPYGVPCFQWCGCVSATRSTLADTIRHLPDLGEPLRPLKAMGTRSGVRYPPADQIEEAFADGS